MNREIDVVPHVIYEVISGSHSYGLNGPQSDEDVRAAYVPRPEHALGLNQYRQQKGESGDEVYVPITRLAKHLAEGSTTWVELLFVEARFVRVQSPFFVPFLENRQLFLTRDLIRKTCGLVKGLSHQAEKLAEKGPEDEQIARKQLMHAVRAGRMVVEALEQFRLNVYRTEDRETLLSIRNGTTPLRAAQEECLSLLQRLNEGIAVSPLPDHPVETAIDALTIHAVIEYWKFQRWM
jgi:hypothetical protein